MSVFSDKTYTNLMEEALARVSDIYDKREGSMIFNGNAPCLAEMAQVYTAIDFFLETTYIHSAPREFLIRRAADHHIYPEPATAAEFRAEFNIDVPIGARFSVDDLNFVVTEKLENEKAETEGFVVYEVKSETVGSIANAYKGNMIAIEYVAGLTKATLVECTKAGVDEEETEAFRKRVLEELRSIAFGGNKADYKKWTRDLDAVKAVKVYPVWNEDIKPSLLIPNTSVTEWYEGFAPTLPNDSEVKKWLEAVYTAAKLKKLTVGGTVKVVFMAYDPENPERYIAPSENHIKDVQEELDPVECAGEGNGIAPIGHVVSVYGVEETEITVSTKIACKNCTFEDIEENIKSVINEYFDELKAEWEDTENLTVRIALIESRIITKLSDYVKDIEGTEINGKTENLELEADCIPKLVEVINKGG